MHPDSSIVKGSSLGAARPVQAGIPPTREDRQRVLRNCRAYVARQRLVPPLSMDELRAHSGRVLALTGLEADCRDWVAVLLNNEVWRETIAGIPFDRRLLLLPQCLRNREQCRAELDDFGLICAECGGCCIGELQAEAVRLGYAVMVAEGSPVVMSLIESGQVQAVIGVSCLSVLERVFPYMEAGAVPGMAIPLLQDGCKDTSVELDWIWEAVYMTRDDKTRRLDLEALRRDVQGWFTPSGLRELLGAPDGETEEIAQAWLARAGKRWRPFLAACAFKALSDDAEAALDDGFRRLAVAIEAFHKASLVHDDIEDGDESRYGQRALHEEYGVPVALNVGDYLLGLGYRLIAELDLPADHLSRMFRVAAEGHLSLCLGQGRELCWGRAPSPLRVDEVIEIFRRKTAPTFEVALRLGAIYADKDHPLRRVLREFSEALGVAYQIRDDLDDFLGREDPGDAYAARPNVLLAIAHERSRGADRQMMERIWRQEGDLAQMTGRIRRVFAALGVEPAAVAMLEACKARAVRSLTALDNASLKGLLRRVVTRIFNDVPVMGCCDDDQAENARRRRRGQDAAE